MRCVACESAAFSGAWRALARRLPATAFAGAAGATTDSSQSTYVIALHWLMYTGKNRCVFFSSGPWHCSYTTNTVSSLLVSACTSRLVDTNNYEFRVQFRARRPRALTLKI